MPRARSSSSSTRSTLRFVLYAKSFNQVGPIGRFGSIAIIDGITKHSGRAGKLRSKLRDPSQ